VQLRPTASGLRTPFGSASHGARSAEPCSAPCVALPRPEPARCAARLHDRQLPQLWPRLSYLHSSSAWTPSAPHQEDPSLMAVPQNILGVDVHSWQPQKHHTHYCPEFPLAKRTTTLALSDEPALEHRPETHPTMCSAAHRERRCRQPCRRFRAFSSLRSRGRRATPHSSHKVFCDLWLTRQGTEVLIPFLCGLKSYLSSNRESRPLSGGEVRLHARCE
jgi:hypothetical protein